MATAEIRIEEQLPDLRSDQIAYKVTISNPEGEVLRLLSVEPKVPAGATLLEITDSSLAQASSDRSELLKDLNQLLRHLLFIESGDFRSQWIARQREAVKEVFSFTGILSLYSEMIFNGTAMEARLKREFSSLSFRIGSAADARSAYDRWMKEPSKHPIIQSVFEEKIKQLERIETRMGEGERPALTTIAPRGSFTATYILRFRRRAFEPRKYQVGFDVLFSDAGGHVNRATASTTAQISPYPINLTGVAILSALLGALLHASLKADANPLQVLWEAASTGRILVGPIVAAIFFNVYEHTALAKDLRLPPSWRSALLIGALAGLAHDRILAALKALIGIGT